MNSTTSAKCFDSDSLFFAVRISLSTILIVLIFISNAVLALFLWRAKSARKIKNGYYGFYLINLCVIDFTAAVNYSVFTACSISFFKYDCPPTVLWRTYSSIHILLSSAWITTIAVMVLERLLLTKNTLLRRKSLRRMKYKLYFTWIWALLNALPQLVWYENVNVETHCICNSQPRVDSLSSLKRHYPVIRIVTMFVLPSTMIIVSVIGVLTRHSCESALSLKRKKGHERFVHLVLLLWLTFVCSNIPKVVFEIAISLRHFRQLDDSRSSRKYEHMFIILLSWTIYLITPIIYFIIYAKILKSDFKKLRKQYPSGETRRMSSYYTSRKISSDPTNDLDCLSTRNILLNLGMHEDNILQRLSIELGNDYDYTYNRRTSVMTDHIRKHSIFGNDMRKISRRQSIFRKRSSATAEAILNSTDGRFLTPFPPTFEYSINTLNQTTPLLEEGPRTKSKASSIVLPFFNDR